MILALILLPAAAGAAAFLLRADAPRRAQRKLACSAAHVEHLFARPEPRQIERYGAKRAELPPRLHPQERLV